MNVSCIKLSYWVLDTCACRLLLSDLVIFTVISVDV